MSRPTTAKVLKLAYYLATTSAVYLEKYIKDAGASPSEIAPRRWRLSEPTLPPGASSVAQESQRGFTSHSRADTTDNRAITTDKFSIIPTLIDQVSKNVGRYKTVRYKQLNVSRELACRRTRTKCVRTQSGTARGGGGGGGGEASFQAGIGICAGQCRD